MNRGSSMNERVIVIRYEYDCFEDRCFDISIRIFLRISRYIKLESSSVETISRYTRNYLFLNSSRLIIYLYVKEIYPTRLSVSFFFLPFSPILARSSTIDNPLYGISFNSNFHRARLIFTLVRFLFDF